MMKKILSLCLVLVMLLGMVVMPASATEGTETTASVLTAEQQAALAAITVEQVANSGKYNLNDIGPWFYAQAGLDASAVLDLSVSGTLNNLTDNGTASPYYLMLVPNSKDEVLPLKDFLIGDLLIVRTKGALEGASASNQYWTALYQGEGKFVVETRSLVSDFATTYEALFTAENPIKDGHTFEWTVTEDETEVTKSATVDAWTEYAVLRPSVFLANEYNVALGEDISLNFIFNGLPYETVDVEITDEGGYVVKTYEDVVVTDGTVTATFSGLTPADVDTKYTATVVNTKFIITHSVLDYCEGALANMEVSNEAWSLIVDLLNYAAAAQAYNGDDATANAGLTDLQKMFASVAPSVETLQPNVSVGEQTLALQWTSVAPALGESIAYRFFYEYDGDVEDLTFCVGETEITPVFGTYNGSTYVEYDALTPADLLTDVVIVAKKGEEVVSASKTFSFGRYAHEILTNDKYASETALRALVNAILSYNVSAEAYTDDEPNVTTIQNTNTTTIAEADKFDLYRKIMNVVNLPDSTMVGGGTGVHAGKAYTSVGLDIVSASLYGMSEDWTSYTQVTQAIFDNLGAAESTTIESINTPESDDYIANFANMLLENSWGGFRVSMKAEDGTAISDNSMSDVCANLQVGDIIVMKVSTGWAQPGDLTLLYIGNNKFIGGACKNNGSSARYVTNGFTVSELLAFCNQEGEYQVRTVAGTKNDFIPNGPVRCYYVLRPSQLLTNAN